MVFSMTAILCEGEVSTEIQTLSYCIMTMSMIQRQTLPSRVVLNMTQRQTLPSCVVLNTTEMQTQIEVREEMMRGMPRCSK